MSRRIDLSKKLTKDEVAYLEARGMTAKLEENKRLVRSGSKPEKSDVDKAADEAAAAEAAEAEKAAEAEAQKAAAEKPADK